MKDRLSALNARIGKNVRHRRMLAGLSQKTVAGHLQISFQQLQKYESGANNITAARLIELAAFYKCSVDELCEDVLEETRLAKEKLWNPHGVDMLIAHFHRIRSRAVRNRVCGIVRAIADSLTEKYQETL